jgi:hypothetical protein
VTKTLQETAVLLADEHRKVDPDTKVIKFFPDKSGAMVRLLEVSSATPTLGQISPFAFNADPKGGIDHPSVVILVSVDEWTDIQAKRLSLPSDWDLAAATDL